MGDAPRLFRTPLVSGSPHNDCVLSELGLRKKPPPPEGAGSRMPPESPATTPILIGPKAMAALDEEKVVSGLGIVGWLCAVRDSGLFSFWLSCVDGSMIAELGWVFVGRRLVDV